MPRVTPLVPFIFYVIGFSSPFYFDHNHGESRLVEYFRHLVFGTTDDLCSEQ